MASECYLRQIYLPENEIFFSNHTHLAQSSTSRRSEHGRTLQYDPNTPTLRTLLQPPPLHSPEVTWLPVLPHEKIPKNMKCPMRCAICNRVFGQCHMVAHERTHTGERPFRCPICFRRFSMKANMKMHVMSVHGISDPHEMELLTESAIMEPQHP
ncbi:unnamed protein product [Gongylonema pulchrum]|uniref:C2H2-type domain-containing protein n=1 Tax=Gongylonema pulchrum TaxID=637853 RepID=A0A3P7QJU6_9BILA|nr:unnamed protein product [Gongylonema pulchrum]